MVTRGGRLGGVNDDRRRMGEREFVLFIGLVSTMAAMAIDMMLPAFDQMRTAFDLAEDSTRLSLTVTLFLMGAGVGNVFYGPAADALGRKPTLVGSMVLYGTAALVCALAPSLTVLFVGRFVWGLASSGSRSLTQAIVRDRYSGTAMARVMTLIQTAFFLGPIFSPLIGKAILEASSWRWVMAWGLVSSTAVVLWSVRLAETLDPVNRRPLRFGPVIAGLRFVIRNRTTLGFTLAITFGFGAFLSYLGSTELILTEIYERPGWFVPFFSASGLIAAVVAFASNRILRTVSAGSLALGAGVAYAAASVLLCAVTVAYDGLPPLVVWLAVFGLANAVHVAVFPSAMSLALEPMGAMAGTAAAVMGFVSSLGGALLASFTDRSIDDTVMPIGIAYAVYNTISLAFQLWARGQARAR